ncbi:amino acid carrier protein [Candidatus Dependentiae bacterium]|nr:amino acid carrier protein [Candidatus Dependentiae bacterium]
MGVILMSFSIIFKHVTEIIPLFLSFLILTISVFLTFKTRFVQFRTIPKMFPLLFQSIFKKKTIIGDADTIPAYKALFTAMSTAVGVGNMFAPAIAIKLGGPGALLGFLLVTLFGSALTFTEVTYAVKYREEHPDGSITGGVLIYIKKALSNFYAKLFAYAGLVTVIIYSGAQANTIADLLQARGIPTHFTGIIIAITITYILIGGIQRIGDFSAKIVPLMFIVYFAGSFWIIFKNLNQLPKVINMIFRTAFTPQAILGAGAGYGFLSAMRWGLAKGFYTNESGTGIATFPHSMAQTKKPTSQGILAIISTFSNGIMCTISGLIVLLTQTWQDPELGVGINIIAKSFSIYFPTIGIAIFLFSALLFAIGTILGNSYNGSQCLLYISNKKYLKCYYVTTAFIIFFSSILDVELLARFTDLLLLPIALPNLLALLITTFKDGDALKINTSSAFHFKKN